MILMAEMKSPVQKGEKPGVAVADILMKVAPLYPASDQEFDHFAIDGARETIKELRKAPKAEQKELATCLTAVVMRAADDAVSVDLGRRGKAHAYFDNVRKTGTPEEKDLAVDMITDIISEELKKTYFGLSLDRVEYGADMLKFLWDERAIDTLKKARVELRKNKGNSAFEDVANTIDETIRMLQNSLRLTKDLTAGQAADQLMKEQKQDPKRAFKRPIPADDEYVGDDQEDFKGK